MIILEFTEPFNAKQMAQMQRMATAKNLTADIYIRTFIPRKNANRLLMSKPVPSDTRWTICRTAVARDKKDTLDCFLDIPDKELTPLKDFNFQTGAKQ